MAKFTVITATKPTTLAKTYRLTSNGVEKSTAAQMIEGTYQVHDFGTAGEFATLLTGIGTNQALVASLPKCGEVR